MQKIILAAFIIISIASCNKSDTINSDATVAQTNQCYGKAYPCLVLILPIKPVGQKCAEYNIPGRKK